MEAPLEDFLERSSADPSARPEPVLAAHLDSCAPCRLAFEEAMEAGALVRAAARPVPDSLAGDPYFAGRVTARLRRQLAKPVEFIPQLEAFSLRLMAAAITIAALLGALSVSGFPRSVRQASARLRPADLKTISPEVNPAPANPDEVVVALWSSPDPRGGRQR
jgi:hypothetical protein